jgi:hypothetical protein
MALCLIKHRTDLLLPYVKKAAFCKSTCSDRTTVESGAAKREYSLLKVSQHLLGLFFVPEVDATCSYKALADYTVYHINIPIIIAVKTSNPIQLEFL